MDISQIEGQARVYTPLGTMLLIVSRPQTRATKMCFSLAQNTKMLKMFQSRNFLIEYLHNFHYT